MTEQVYTVEVVVTMPSGKRVATSPFQVRENGDLKASVHKVKQKAGERFLDALGLAGRQE